MSKTKIAKLFGNRVALRILDEEYDGLLVPAPGTSNRLHVIGEIVARGTDAPAHLAEGDIVLWQMNAVMSDQFTHQVGGEMLLVLPCGDIVARLKNRKINCDTFAVVGDWCLISREVVQPGRIILPDTVAATSPDVEVRLKVVQKGETFDVDVDYGDNILVSRTVANPIELDGKQYFYVLKSNVLGARGVVSA